MTKDAGSDFRSQLQTLARNGIALAAGGVVAQLVFTLLEILVARKLGAEAYGIFVTAYAWTVLGALLMEFGTPMWAIQEGSRDHGRIPVLLGSGLSINLAVFGILYLSVLLLLELGPESAVLAFLPILLPYGLILAVQNALAAVYSSYQTMQVNAFFQGLAPLAILAVYFAYAAGDLSLQEVGTAYVIGAAVVTGIWFVCTLRKVRPTVSSSGVRTALHSSYQYGLTGILGQIFFKTDVIMLSALAGLREAGIYAAAFKLVELLYKVAILSGRVFAPAIFKASRKSDKSFSLLASLMSRFLAIAGLGAGLVSFVMADELILLLYGESYQASADILRILGGVMATNSMMVVLQLLMSSIDMHSQRVSIHGVVVVVQIAANAVLIPRYGAIGAACATLFSGTLLIVSYAAVSASRGGFRFLRWLLLPSVLAVSVAIASLLIDTGTLTRAAISLCAFTVALFAAGFVHRDEVRYVLRTVLAKDRG